MISPNAPPGAEESVRERITGTCHEVHLLPIAYRAHLGFHMCEVRILALNHARVARKLHSFHPPGASPTCWSRLRKTSSRLLIVVMWFVVHECVVRSSAGPSLVGLEVHWSSRGTSVRELQCLHHTRLLHSLEQQNVWLGLVHFIMLPPQTLCDAQSSPLVFPQQLQCASGAIEVVLGYRLEHLLGQLNVTVLVMVVIISVKQSSRQHMLPSTPPVFHPSAQSCSRHWLTSKNSGSRQ